MDRAEVRNLMKRLDRDAERIAERFSLSYRSIKPERANVRRRYGVCYSDGSIQIRLRHATSGRPLKYSSLINTLCHELAHLRYFNHGARFHGFYRKLLRWARDEGIYQPRALTAPGLARVTDRQGTTRGLAPGAQTAQTQAPEPPLDDEAATASPTQLTLFS